MMNMDSKDALVVFEGTKIRRTWHDDQWYFSVVDVVRILTDSADPKDYWYRLKKREAESSGIELSTFCRQLKLPSTDGKKYETDCANTESMFRIIQSIPSPKAEPFKRWLAKGYSDEWIEKRARGIAIRDELTDEWDKRGISSKQDYSILTADISRATFGLTPTEYKRLKGLRDENLRDHMDDIELILTMLGEATTTRFTRDRIPGNSPSCETMQKTAEMWQERHEKISKGN